MDAYSDLQTLRRGYARQTLARIGIENATLEMAFATVPRERFLPPGPWQILLPTGGYQLTPDADPANLYTDDVIGIVPECKINNGQPSLHAHLLNLAEIHPGDHAVHIGTGAGYYTAIIAELVGAAGRVTGIEFDLALATAARRNLDAWPSVRVLQGDGSGVEIVAADVIYVNAGATRPAEGWLDGLKVGGRLILPLTTNEGFGSYGADERQGGVFRIVRSADRWDARWICGVAIFPCAGVRDEASERALAAAFHCGGWEKVRRLYRRDDLPEERCWLRGIGWCFAFD